MAAGPSMSPITKNYDENLHTALLALGSAAYLSSQCVFDEIGYFDENHFAYLQRDIG